MASTSFKKGLTDVSNQELKSMKEAIDKEVKSRRSVDDLLVELRDTYNAIDWGPCDWYSRVTCNAVDVLEKQYSKVSAITKAIRGLSGDVHTQWDKALTFSVFLADMITTAERNAGKLVNGSEGDWCHETAGTIISLWDGLIDSGVFPSDATKEEVRVALSSEIDLGHFDLDDEFESVVAKLMPDAKAEDEDSEAGEEDSEEEEEASKKRRIA